jgi:50S ribosomal subunit-associated GTPase HflX
MADAAEQRPKRHSPSTDPVVQRERRAARERAYYLRNKERLCQRQREIYHPQRRERRVALISNPGYEEGGSPTP